MNTCYIGTNNKLFLDIRFLFHFSHVSFISADIIAAPCTNCTLVEPMHGPAAKPTPHWWIRTGESYSRQRGIDTGPEDGKQLEMGKEVLFAEVLIVEGVFCS